jgi:cell division protein FtsI (penicillin-binding protein 3)
VPTVNLKRRPSAVPQRMPEAAPVNSAKRARILYGLLLLVSAVFIIRLFYLQVIRHDYYHKAALASQLKQYLIPAERGTIYAHDGDDATPLVLNEIRYTLFADPTFVKNAEKEGTSIQGVIGGDVSKIFTQLKTPGTRYVILAKKLSKEQADKIAKFDYAGIGTRKESYRTYPQGQTAAQVLGFVNNDGAGQYGIEQYYDRNLAGTPGELKAITDASGVPLVSNPDNIVRDAEAGDKITLTIDIGMQRQVEQLLKEGLEKAKSKSGSAIVMDPYTGAIKAMANYPSYDPAKLTDVTDLSVLSNASVSSPLEVGSIMKTLTAAAALDQGVVTPDTSYYDSSRIKVDDATVTNIEEDGGAGTRTVADILQLSLNTGAVYLLQQMGGGQLNSKARTTWNDYLTNHYRLGRLTGIEQGGESTGYIPDPNDGFGLNITYANMAFGQGMTATPLQMAAALSSVVNGGTYFKPHLVESTKRADGRVKTRKPEVVKANAVSAATSTEIVQLSEYVYTSNHTLYGMPQLRDGYSIGGKTGTAQVAKPTGGYYADRFNGTFSGFVGGDKPEYVIIVRVNEPGIGGYAGSKAAAPLFTDIVNMLIDNFGVTPKS